MTHGLIGGIVSYVSNELVNEQTDVPGKRGDAMDFQEGVSLYLQIAQTIEDDILAGTLREEDAAPSTNALARYYQINPATALKGVNLLVDEGVLYKKRGVGMFVATGAKAQIEQKRRKDFFKQHLPTLIAQARKLGIDREMLCTQILNTNEEEG